jgi:hypothetical protein
MIRIGILYKVNHFKLGSQKSAEMEQYICNWRMENNDQLKHQT